MDFIMDASNTIRRPLGMADYTLYRHTCAVEWQWYDGTSTLICVGKVYYIISKPGDWETDRRPGCWRRVER